MTDNQMCAEIMREAFVEFLDGVPAHKRHVAIRTKCSLHNATHDQKTNTWHWTEATRNRDVGLVRRGYVPGVSEVRNTFTRMARPLVSETNIGRHLTGFFPTPAGIVQAMLDRAEIRQGHRVLEKDKN